MLDTPGFAGKSVLVTGGNTGIGANISREFCKRGASVFVNYIEKEDSLEALKAESFSLPGTMEGIKADITSEQTCKDMILRIVERFGKLDILINNAGLLKSGLLTTMTSEDALDVIRVNLSGTFYCCKSALPYMKQRNSGKIINIGSCLALKPQEGTTVYSAAKAGIIGLTRSIAKEIEDTPITINTLLLGGVEDTGILKKSKSIHLKRLANTLFTGRLLKSEEIIAMIVLVCDESSTAISGHMPYPSGTAFTAGNTLGFYYFLIRGTRK
jgi:3-oxoacyl-[acyl-carrier protein] reductase